MSSNRETAVLGGGCFWCTEGVLKELKGVVSVTPGYAGGTVKNPTYEQVSSGETGHAEVAKVEFDPTIISYRDLVDIFMHTHNPTTLNQQGNDIGTQYRSVIFYTSETQKETAEELLTELAKSGEYKNPIVTDLQPLDVFYEAEEYHKDYYKKNPTNPYCFIVISPKIAKLRQKYQDRLKE